MNENTGLFDKNTMAEYEGQPMVDLKIDDVIKISKARTVEETTFKPIITLTVRLDVEGIQDLKAWGKTKEQISQGLAEKFLEAVSY